VFVIGRKSFGYVNLRPLLNMPPERFPALRSHPSLPQMEINAVMQRSVPPKIFVDQQRMLCGDGTACPLFTPTGELITFDGNHLTQAGAQYLGALVFRDARLAPYAPADKLAVKAAASPRPAAPAVQEAVR
jgi:hypothetical protein